MLYNRDLSWLSFNHRVLQEAANKKLPVYERLKFLAIFSSNLDEFFRVRYPLVVAFSKLNKKTIRRESFLTENDIAENIQQTIQGHLEEFGHILIDDLIPELKQNNIAFYYNQQLLPEHLPEIRQIFLSQVLSFVQPVFLNAESGYNFLPENNRLYFIVTISHRETETVSHVAVNIPSAKLKRFFELEQVNGQRYVIFIDDIMRENMGVLFPGQTIESIYSIKFNRDAEIKLNDEYRLNLLEKIEKQLSKRDVGAASRFLYEQGMPANLRMFLASLFKARLSDMFEGRRYHNLSDLMSFPVFDKELQLKPPPRISFPAATTGGDIFSNISQKDILLHLPYHSYVPVLSFFNQAAVDADVSEIFITLYRVASESHIVNALISAAKNGKKVTAFIELKARFDEANNIKWSRVMKNAGVRLIYSDPKIKVHSKIALVKKERDNRTSCFAVLSTGNFNESTAAFYTDHVLMTTNKKICDEMEWLFTFMQKRKHDPLKVKPQFSELYVSQFNLLPGFTALINEEIAKAKAGKPALIRIKVNNLEEPEFIDLVYRAAREGVTVHLIVRSVCCLIPEANITLRRIVDQYLEHTRLFIFGADAEAKVIMGSSDLMTRNLRRRIEVCVEVKESNNRQQLLRYFELQWQDNTNAVEFDGEMLQHRIADGAGGLNAQTEIYNYLKKVSC